MIWGRFGKVFFPMHRLLFLHASSLGFAATKTRKNNKLPEQDVFLLVFVAPIWNDQHSLSKASSATKTSKPKKLQISIRLSFPTPLLPPSWPGGMREAINPPPHRRWRRVLDSESTWLRQILANIYEAKLVIFEGPGLDVGLPPLYLSPGPRTFRRAGPKSPADLRLTLFFSIF